MKSNSVAISGYSVEVSEKSTWILIELTLEGAVGVGEATAFGSEVELAGLIANLASWANVQTAIGLPDLIFHVLQSDATLARRTLASALEQAWFGALAARADLPLGSLLGGAHRDTIPFYANINRGIADRSPSGFAAQAEETVRLTGAAGVKIAPFDGLRSNTSSLRAEQRLLEVGLERVAAVRARIGPDRLLLVDCHARLSPFHACEVIRAIAPLNIFWIEDPCAPEAAPASAHISLRHLANAKGMRVAGGEAVSGFAALRHLLALDAYDVVLPDLRCTGLMQGIAMLRYAESRGVSLSIHNPVGPILDAVSVHVASVLPSFLILERQLGETPLFDGIVTPKITANGEGVIVPPGPHLGLQLQKSKLEPIVTTKQGLRLTRSFSGLAGAGPDS